MIKFTNGRMYVVKNTSDVTNAQWNKCLSCRYSIDKTKVILTFTEQNQDYFVDDLWLSPDEAFNIIETNAAFWDVSASQ